MPAPEPYYERAGVQLYLGRCEDVLPHLSGVQLTVTSPPYNQISSAAAAAPARAAKNRSYGKENAPPGTKSKENTWAHAMAMATVYDDDLPEPDYQAQQVSMADMVAKASTPTAAFFYNHKVRYRAKVPLHPLHLVDRFTSWQLLQEIVWDRPGGRGSTVRFTDADERVYWLVRDRGDLVCTDYARSITNLWRMLPNRRHVRLVGREAHPVPFPPELPERAIRAASRPGDLVLDPYAGSGTTLRVALHYRRRAVGIEAHEPYAQAAAELLEAM